MQRDLNETINAVVREWCEANPAASEQLVLNAIEDAKADAPVMWAEAQAANLEALA